MLAAAVASFGEHSLGTDQSNSISMDLFSAFGEYINPFTCPINVFEVHVLGKCTSLIAQLDRL